MNRRGSVALSFLIGLTVMLLVGYTTDQIIQKVYDSTNTALRANVVAGGGGSVGPGTVNTIAKFTPSTTTIGNSSITDDGSAGAIAISGGRLLFTGALSFTSPSWAYANATNQGFGGNDGTIAAIIGGTTVGFFNANTLGLAVGTELAWGSSGFLGLDLFLARDGAGSLKMGRANLIHTTPQFLHPATATSAGVAGGAFTLAGGTANGTDQVGGALTLQQGIGTGAGNTTPVTIVGDVIGSTGSTLHSTVTREAIGISRVLANNTVTAEASFTMANNTVVAGTADYSCQVFNGTDLQIEEGQISFHATNKNNTPANNTVVKYGNQQAATTGTIAVTWTITAANPAVLSVNCNSSLTPSTGYPILTYNLHNLTGQAVAIQ